MNSMLSDNIKQLIERECEKLFPIPKNLGKMDKVEYDNVTAQLGIERMSYTHGCGIWAQRAEELREALEKIQKRIEGSAWHIDTDVDEMATTALKNYNESINTKS